MNDFLNKIKQSFLSNFKENILNVRNPFIYVFSISIIFLLISSINNKNLFYAIYGLHNKVGILNLLMIFSAKYLIFTLALLYIIWITYIQRVNIFQIVLITIGVGVISLIIARILTHSVIDIRPYIEYSFKPLITGSLDNGFPSDHTLLSFCLASSSTFISKKTSIIFYLIAFLIGFSRVFVGVHHPLDIAGSMVITLSAALIYLLIQKAIKKRV